MLVLMKVLTLRNAEKDLSLVAFVAGITSNKFKRMLTSEYMHLTACDKLLKNTTTSFILILFKSGASIVFTEHAVFEAEI